MRRDETRRDGWSCFGEAERGDGWKDGGRSADRRVYYREREYFSIIVMEMKWIASTRFLVRNKGYMRAQCA